jgi:hypothetical protein
MLTLKNCDVKQWKSPISNLNKIYGIVFGIHGKVYLWPDAKYFLIRTNINKKLKCSVMFHIIPSY